MSTPAIRNLAFTRSNGYRHELTFTDDATPPGPLFWSDMTFAAQIRRFPDDVVATSFTVDATGLGSGVLILTLTKEETALLPEECVWDLLMTDSNGIPTTLVAGDVVVRRNVTRPS